MPDSGLPTRFPIFPLPSLVLFPGTNQRLQMFEPRYRALTASALDGAGVIGMTLLRELESAPPAGPAPVYDVGCAGRIAFHELLPDGRYHLVLVGERRFRILEQEPRAEGFIEARVELLPDPGFEELPPDERTALGELRPELETKTLDYTGRVAPRAVDPLRERIAELDPIALVNAVAYGLVGTFAEKQSLLETESPLERARLLLSYLDFELAASRLPGDHNQLN